MNKRIAFGVLVCIMLLSSIKVALACKGTQVLFEDNFTTLDQAWGISDNNKSVKDGKLILQPDINRSYTTINQANLFGDMDFCGNVSLAKSDPPTPVGGLIFWAKDYSDYYLLAITGDGNFEVVHWASNRFLIPVPFQPNAAIKKDIGQVNQLRVVTKGNQATAYINDVQVAIFNGQPPQGGGLIGVQGNSPEKSQSVWEFSNLKITKP